MNEIDIRRLQLEPGDTVVLKCKGVVSSEIAIRIRAEATKYLPAGQKVLVLNGDIDISVLSAEQRQAMIDKLQAVA